MLTLPPSTRIFVSTHPVDMRRSFDGLLALVRDYLGHEDPFTGHLFIFRNKTGDRLKALWWDRDGLAIFYTATKARDGPTEMILKNYKGYLQADAANVFDGFYRPGNIVEVGCWAHARRYFHDARTNDAARAAEALARIGFFYDVEREAKKIIDEQKLDGTQADGVTTEDASAADAPQDPRVPELARHPGGRAVAQESACPSCQLCPESLGGVVAVHAARVFEH